jgi:hypothetical protein
MEAVDLCCAMLWGGRFTTPNASAHYGALGCRGPNALAEQPIDKYYRPATSNRPGLTLCGDIMLRLVETSLWPAHRIATCTPHNRFRNGLSGTGESAPIGGHRVGTILPFFLEAIRRGENRIIKTMPFATTSANVFGPSRRVPFVNARHRYGSGSACASSMAHQAVRILPPLVQGLRFPAIAKFKRDATA